MIEVKYKGREVQKYIVVLKEGSGMVSNIKCDTFDAFKFLTLMVQHVSRLVELPVEVVVETIKDAPILAPDVTIDMNQIMKMFGRDR